MQKATRNCTVRLYPTKRQEAVLSDWLELHRQLYNNSLAERKNAWEKEKRAVSYNEQQNALPDLKEQRPEHIPLGSHALQETVRRSVNPPGEKDSFLHVPFNLFPGIAGGNASR